MGALFHKHHTIPRHAGGTNHQSNIEYITVEEHALAHKKLFEQHGRWQDELAWKALSGQITEQEIIRTKQSHFGEKNGMFGKKHTKDSIEKMRDVALIGGFGKGKRTKEICDKLKDIWTKEKRTERSQKYSGSNNPMFGKKRTKEEKELISKNNKRPHIGKIWITNGTERKYIKSEEDIPFGFRRGMK